MSPSHKFGCILFCHVLFVNIFQKTPREAFICKDIRDKPHVLMKEYKNIPHGSLDGISAQLFTCFSSDCGFHFYSTL